MLKTIMDNNYKNIFNRRLWRVSGFLMLFVLWLPLANAQVGNTFWFVAPEVSSEHSDEPIALRITAMDKNVTVTISMPADPAKGTITRTINAFQQTTVNMNDGFFTLNNVENRPNNTILNKGLLITSTGGDVSVYYEVSSPWNPDIFTLKGESAVGTEFYVPGQSSFTNHNYSNPRPYERVDIVATEDNTQVTIVPSQNILGGTAGTPITITLNKGQTYGIVSANWNTANYTLAGTKITSTKNIAVTVSDDSIEQFINNATNAWDLIGDQIVPTNIIGNEYIAIKTTTTTGAINKVYILAIQDNTSVTIDGNAATALNKGQIKEIDITNAAAYIKTSSPVYAYQVSGLPNGTQTNEMGSALLPTIKCTGSKFVSFTRNFNAAYWVQIMTQRKSMGNFKMYDSGNEIATFSAYLNNSSNWQAVPSSGAGDEQWYTTTIPMSSAPFSISTGRVYSVENNLGLFHLGVLDKNGGSLSYGYYSSYSNVKIDGPTQTCFGDKVILESKYTGGTISWLSSITGNTVLSTQPTLEVTESAIYWVKLDNQLGCVATDSLDVKFRKPIFELSSPGTVCPNEPVTFTLPAEYTYVWSNGATGNTTTVTPLKGQTIDLSVTATDIAGCSTKDAVVVISHADDMVDLIDVASQVCVGDTIKNQTVMAKYEWTVNGDIVPDYDKPYILASVSGTYKLTGTTVHNCVSSDTKTITVNPLPVITMTNQTVCSNTPVVFNGPAGMSSYLWSNNSTGSSLTATTPGTYSLQVTDNKGCKANSSATVAWHPQSTVQISYQTTTIASSIAPDNIYTCPENNVTLTAPVGFANYQWSVDGVVSQGPALTSINITVTSATQKSITLEVTDANECTATDNTKVIAYTSPVLAVDKAAYCQLETMTATTVMNSYEWLYNSAVVGTGKTQVASQTGTYTVRARDVNGCVTQSINITSNALPLASIISTPVCASDPFVLTGQPASGVTYQWSQESTPVNTGTNYTASTFAVAPINTNRVWLEVTNANGCKAKASAIPSWFPLPTVDISYFNDLLSTTISANEINLCPEKNIVLNGTASSTAGITTYRWYVNGTFQAGNNTNSLNITTPKQGQTTIRLEVVDNRGCTSSDQTVLKVFADPNDLLTMPSEICLGQPLSVESIRTNLDRHEWSFGATTTSQYSFTPLTGGVYDLTIWDKNGCRATAQYSVNDPAITLTDVPSNVAECANTPHTFAVDPKANYDYVWSNSSTGTSFTANSPGSFWVEATHNSLGCKDRKTMALAWHPNQLFDFGDILSVCATAAWPFIVSGDAAAEFTNWRWEYNSLVVSTSNSYSIEATQVGTYTVSATYTKDGISCNVSDNFEITVLPDLPAINLDNETSKCGPNTICLCEGEEILIKANNGFISYQWYWMIGGSGGTESPIPGQTNAALAVSISGVYKLKAVQPNGCESEAEIEVKVTEKPHVVLNDPSPLCEGKSVMLENTLHKSNYQYEWVFNGITPIGGNSFFIDADQKGTYSLTAKVVGADIVCSDEDSKMVSSPIKPNVILSDKAICGGNSYDLSTQFNPGSVSGLNSYGWFQNATQLSNTKVSAAAIYELRMNVDHTNISCDYNFPMALSVIDLPVLPVSSDYMICNGQTAQLNANGNYLSYNWSFYGNNDNGAPDMTKTFPNEKIIDATDAGYYKVRAWTQQGDSICSNISSPILLTVNSLPQLTITPDKTYLCENGLVTMTAANALALSTNFEWENGTTGNALTVSSIGYYEVKATDSNGCEATEGHDVIAYTPTDIVLPDFPAICDGQTVTLPSIPGVHSFQWFYNNVGNVEQGLFNQPWVVGKDGDYVVSYTTEADPDGCPIEKTVTVTVLPVPVLTATAPTTLLCDGDDFTLDAGNDYPTYTWTLLGTNGNPDQIVGLNRTYVGNQTGSYQLQAWTSSGCNSALAVDVLVNANPNVSLGNDFSACVGSTFTLSLTDATNLSNIVWRSGNTVIASDVTSYSTKTTGTYTVTAFSPVGCSSTDEITVTQFTPVVVTFPQVAPICSNDTYTLTSPLVVPTDIQSYQWFFGSVGGTPQGMPNAPWTVNTAGNYVLQTIDLNNCASEHVFKLATIPAPDFSLAPDREGCYADTLKIVAKQSYIRYQWNGNPADNQYFKVVDPAVSFYSLEVEDRNGCISTSSVNYIVNPLPVVNLGNDITICAGPMTRLDPGGPYASVRWSTGAISPTLDVDAGTYSVMVTDFKGCQATDDITINWLPNPNPDLGPDEIICPLEDLLLDAGPGFQNYIWHSGDFSQTVYANIVDTINMVTVTDFNGCKGWDQKLVFKMPQPNYILAGDTATCANEVMVLDAGYEYSQFLWSTGETTQTIDVMVPGDYWVRASDGCFAVRDTVNVSFWDLPVVAQMDTMIYAQITILAEGGLRPYLYSLNDGRLQPDSVFKKLENGTYIGLVVDENGCATTDTVTISSVVDLDIPKFFTPNGDGFNDVWEIGGLERFPFAEVVIYDRYGKQLAKFGNDPAKWDGRYLNQPMPSDDYWYVISLVQVNKQIKGNLTLKR
jgi:gliding motility-associated-like protein